MNDDIKEILNQLEYFNEEDYKYYSDFKLNRNQIKQLLDYITNLQHTEDLYNQLLKDYDEEIEENIKLTKLWKNEVEKRREAVEYIKNTPLYETTYDYNMEEELEIQNVSDETASNKLLDILNGKE